jgi:hypothetical protein
MKEPWIEIQLVKETGKQASRGILRLICFSLKYEPDPMSLCSFQPRLAQGGKNAIGLRIAGGKPLPQNF